VTHPLAPQDNTRLYRLLGGVFSREQQAALLCRRFEQAYQDTLASVALWETQRVLYLIWKSPWMTVSPDTYVARMLAAVRWQTLAVKSDARYPTVELSADLLRNVDVVLLSTEPYSFRERHCVEMIDLLPADSHTRVALIDGAMTSWYGSRAIEGLAYLRDFRRGLD
jgi:ABC-type Fe3+-hydroxamate transport system substrate-binding protein